MDRYSLSSFALTLSEIVLLVFDIIFAITLCGIYTPVLLRSSVVGVIIIIFLEQTSSPLKAERILDPNNAENKTVTSLSNKNITHINSLALYACLGNYFSGAILL